MESRVSNLEAKFDEFKKSHDLILLQLQFLMAKCHDSISNSRQPFIKMASHISVLKSDEIVLKLQSFHNEKIQAREKVDEFLSQYRPKYKPKSPPCLRPTLKKFKRVRAYAKCHEDGSAMFRSSSKFQESSGFFRSKLARKNEKVFDLLEKQVEDSVKSPPFLDYVCKTSIAKDLVSGLTISELWERKDELSSFRPILENKVGFQLIVFVGTISKLQSLKNLDHDFPIRFDVGFILDAKQMLLPTEGVAVHLGHNVFDELPHSTNNCVLQLGYHMPISDSGGTLITRHFTSKFQVKDAYNSKLLVCNGEFLKNGTTDLGDEIVLVVSNFCDKKSDESKIMAVGFVGFYPFMNAQPSILENECQQELVGMYAHHVFVGMHQTVKIVSLKLGFHEFICDKGGTTFLSSFESMDLWASCEDSGFCVVCYVVLDRDYCKGIRDKGGGSKFRYMVTLNIHFSCINASGDSIECSQDGIFGVILLVAYSTCIVVGGEFYSSNIELGRAGKKKSPNVREDYLVHRFYRQKKLTFESNVHGSFGLQDTSHVLEGGKDINNTTFMSGLLTGGRIMTMRDAVILYHLSKNDAEQRKLDVAFIGAKYMLKLENGCSVSVANDLIIQVGDSNFYLHKFPMVMRRGYLNRLVFQRINVGRDASPRIHLDNLPRGAKVFESVVKFCYGWKFDLINIAPLYCATHFLEMSDDFKQGNLISKTETFLSFLIFPSWKDTFRILRSCESISLCAKELKISKRSMEAIAWNARTNLNACSSETDEIQCFNVLPNNAENSRLQGAADIWWFEDVSFLRINHFIEVIQALNCKGSCIAHWTAKWLSRVTSRLERMSLKHMTHQFLGVTTECLVKDVVDGAICSKL